MPQYHPSAEQECRDVLAQGGRDIKICFGMMLKRHLAIRDGTEVLTASELLPASGPDLTKLYEVTYSYNLHARLTAIHASKDEGVTLLAVDAWQGFSRIGLSYHAPDALARASGRTT